MMTPETRAALTEAHDLLDDRNAAEGQPGRLCLLCDAADYEGSQGIVHASDCLLVRIRALLARPDPEPLSLPSPDKLEMLAAWLDLRYPEYEANEVQRDLRRWASGLRCNYRVTAKEAHVHTR